MNSFNRKIETSNQCEIYLIWKRAERNFRENITTQHLAKIAFYSKLIQKFRDLAYQPHLNPTLPLQCRVREREEDIPLNILPQHYLLMIPQFQLILEEFD
jgi:hypothetical protein